MNDFLEEKERGDAVPLQARGTMSKKGCCCMYVPRYRIETWVSR
jgi:hypothetical protein